MDQNILKDLNSEQQQALLATEGVSIILAGAGSGKTRVLTYKVLYLMIKENVAPEHILMITFTNKASNEMKERVHKYLVQNNLPLTHQPTIATFHSLCAKILRIEGRLIGLSNSFLIYDAQDQLELIKETMKLMNISVKDYKPNAVLATISQAKNELLTPPEYSSSARGNFFQVVALIYSAYQKLLKENNAVDFDDLLLETVFLFDKYPEILEKYQDKFQYILVDEYQDTNKAQYKLTKMLARKYGNLCVVGDFSQSIYSWRGADFQNLSKLHIDFPNVKTFKLSQNYRSTQKILDAASQVIKQNTTHPVLMLWTDNPDGEDIVLYEARNEEEEATYISQFIQQYGMSKLDDIAILYRTNAQSRVIEEVLLHQGIPYVLVGGTRFYDRKEIKDVLSYLRVISNPKDTVSYKRIEKLGKGRLQKFLEFQEILSNKSVISRNDMTKQSKKDKIATLAKGETRNDNIFDSGVVAATPPQNDIQSTLDLLDQILQKTDYLSLYDEKDEEDRQRLENIKELRSVAIAFPELSQFLENVSLVEQESIPDHPAGRQAESGKENAEIRNAVTLMTLHAAKGLEFPVVFMIGMEEGLFPHSRSLMDRNELEEERRLCYVGMTRAKEKLFLTYARRRLFFGQRSSNTVSRFILELPEKVLENNLRNNEYNDQSSDFI